MFQNRKNKWKKDIWLASKLGTIEDEYGNLLEVYDRPKAYKMNVQPISSEADMQEFGQNAKQMQKAIIEYKRYCNKLKEFDIAYLDGATPLLEESIIIKANEIDTSRVSLVNQIKVKNLSSGTIECYYGTNANYKLYPPRNQNKAIQIYFERLTAK